VELIYLIMSCYQPKTTLIPVPAFSEYERAARGVHSKIQFLRIKEKEGFKLNLSGGSKADMLILGSPNNPTGNLLREDCPDVVSLVHKLAVIDEAFMDFVPQERRLTLIGKAAAGKKIIVLRTFTKFFALAGLRIGYAVAHKEIIRRLRAGQIPWSVNALAQAAAQAALEDKGYIEYSRKFVAEERVFLTEQLSGIRGLRVYPSAANFLLLKIEQAGVDSASLTQRMLTRGILIRDCSNFRNLTAQFVRVAVRNRTENERLIIAFKEVLPDARN
ncbi:MAG: aminotransferase class I/II-fold pyridoxal phosphate-dependent enzyme, partial [Candidatus Omnitrophota bacterium]